MTKKESLRELRELIKVQKEVRAIRLRLEKLIKSLEAKEKARLVGASRKSKRTRKEQ